MGKRGETARRTPFEKRVVYAASLAARRALRAGVLERPSRCSRCLREQPPHQKPHGHHEDYSLPLWVVWLCSFCHVTRHLQFDEQGYDPFWRLRDPIGLDVAANTLGVSKHWLLTGEPAEAAA